MRRSKLYGTTFCGNEASDYAKEQGYLDYATFAKAFDAVLNNSIMENTCEIGFWEQENGIIDNTEEVEALKEEITDIENRLEFLTDEEIEETQMLQEEIDSIQEQIEELDEEQGRSYNQEIFQYYIVSDQGAEMIKQYTEDPLFYNETLDMYVWGITHYGTAWGYVLTDVKLNCKEEAFE
nr:MAG TPA: zipper dimerization domain transcription factor-like protein [Caudoviricetes sp.]